MCVEFARHVHTLIISIDSRRVIQNENNNSNHTKRILMILRKSIRVERKRRIKVLNFMNNMVEEKSPRRDNKVYVM